MPFMDFWIRLKNEIKEKNTTQEWIANKIGVPFGTFRKWMTRKTYPNIKEGIEIAKNLDTSVEYLLTGIKSEGLSDTEKKLINSYRKLTANDKENALLAINAWLNKK
ncbi:MAG: helix-turn-helix domain-containing protein [Treponema sp.]|nr:helix-turn-helix domain-containing protein [Treponema sp.]